MTFFGKAILLSSLFSSAKLGVVCGLGFWFMEVVMHDVAYANRRNMDLNTQFWVAMNPFISISFSGDIFLALDAGGIGLNFSNLDF
jgi:ABC-type transport system involved in multi-copper enzyme maturation permease subunit